MPPNSVKYVLISNPNIWLDWAGNVYPPAAAGWRSIAEVSCIFSKEGLDLYDSIFSETQRGCDPADTGICASGGLGPLYNA